MPNEGAFHERLPLTLLLGGVRSGKSARAVAAAESLAGAGGRVLFAATGEAFDDDMARRIAAHRAERPAHWDTVEAPAGLAGALRGALAVPNELGSPYAAVVVDCLTLWTSNLLLALDDPRGAEAVAAGRARELLEVVREVAAAAAPAPRWILVSNEVGLGVVPPTPLGRAFRDALGRVNQVVAAAADEVTLMVAGLEVPVRRR